MVLRVYANRSPTVVKEKTSLYSKWNINIQINIDNIQNGIYNQTVTFIQNDYITKFYNWIGYFVTMIQKK